MTDILYPTLALAAAYLGLTSIGFDYAGPAAVLVGLTVMFAQIGVTRSTLTELGLGRPRSWLGLILWTVLGVVAVVLAVTFGARPLIAALDLPPSNLSRLAALKGDAEQLAIMLAIAWTTAAIGEELFFRGYLLGRIQSLFGGGWLAMALAVVVQALLFGLAHAYQGPAGAIQTATVGFVLGAIFVAAGRNIWPVILAHGLIDTMSLVALYLGAMPR